jgi:hypothetical protein
MNPLVSFYDIQGGKREVLFFYFIPDTTREQKSCLAIKSIYLVKKYLNIDVKMKERYKNLQFLFI